MAAPAIPAAALAHHLAVLGKTGSGKTTTVKGFVEGWTAAGERVCILDPVKSDYWGLTSSADGKSPGLPFPILGGPHGHLPLSSGQGRVIGQLVASGQLPLSILDMKQFEPGGWARFFCDFAPALLEANTGVVHLVIEEAHLFAPKERSGLGQENLAIHYAKMMATAGRSQGIRMVIATQRTQALHNALLGSCETLIAHRVTLPADQAPIVKWLKANLEKRVAAEIAGDLSALKTGSAWVCSGEERFFQQVEFPPIATFDNSATPTGETAGRKVRTAPIDIEALRLALAAPDDKAGQLVDQAAAEQLVEPAGKWWLQHDIERKAYDRGYADAEAEHADLPTFQDGWRTGALEVLQACRSDLEDFGSFVRKNLDGLSAKFAANIATHEDLLDGRPAGPPAGEPGRTSKPEAKPSPSKAAAPPAPTPIPQEAGGADPTKALGTMAQRLLNAIKAGPDRPLSWSDAAILAGVSNVSGPFHAARNQLRASGAIREDGQDVVLLAGRGEVEPLTAPDVTIAWSIKLPSMAARIFDHLLDTGEGTKEGVAAAIGVSAISGPYHGGWKALRNNNLVVSAGNGWRLAPIIVELQGRRQS